MLCCVLTCCSLDYPGIGPEHSFLRDVGRAEYYAVTDDEALEAFQRLSELEGIIPALETSHAIAYLEVSEEAFRMWCSVLAVETSNRQVVSWQLSCFFYCW